MSVDNLLSKEEIDTLLEGVDEGEVDTTPAPTASAERYDITSQDHIVRGRMPTLEMINERFTRYTRVSMFNFLRQTIEVTFDGIENIKYSEYLQTMSMPTSINLVKIKPLRGTALFVFNSDLVVKLVDQFFGGGAEDVTIEERGFTPTEVRVANKLLTQVFTDMKEAWKTVMPIEFEYTGAEDNPAMANMISPSEVMVLSSFSINIEGVIGRVQVAIPYSMLEPVRETLDAGVQTDKDDVDGRWAQCVQEDMLDANVPINCTVASRKISLRDIVAFKPGDVIPISMPDTLSLTANGVPVFKTRLGTSNGHLALKVIEQIKRPQRS